LLFFRIFHPEKKNNMKKIFFTIALLLTLSLLTPHTSLFSQTYIPITDNMQIQSFSNIKFAAGNYTFPDAAQDGVIQINGKNNITLDGDSCFVDGTNYVGYMIKITNSHHITIKNFDSVFKYKYAVHIMNSHHININGNNFSYNKVDSIGWIDVWADYNQALGGGVMMYQSRAAEISYNTMRMQNDGVALYHCDSIRVHHNNFEWNTSYGIRMFWTDSCHIYNNLAYHINRPYEDPSDCAALLMIISNENRVEYNDLSYSGDGVFLGQYQQSATPNNNYFAYNECSYSPHNAIEATFADGNVYKHNKCNVSHYGFWLGYSFNSIVDSNEVNGNFNSGIAIDRGYNNYIAHNLIRNNPIGIELWEGSNIPGYETQFSHDYLIHDNAIEGNSTGISAAKTERSVFLDNDFLYNQAYSLYLTGLSTEDTLYNNEFRSPTAYHIYNNSTNDIYAAYNTWIPGDSLVTEDKIFDKKDVASKGEVIWHPILPALPIAVQSTPPCDMAEPGTIWYAYPELGYAGPRIPDTVYFDTTEKKVGLASVKLVSGRGWNDGLNYRPGADSLASWQLTENDTLYFWVRTIKNPQGGFQYYHIRIGDHKGNYYKYTAQPGYLNNANNLWKRYKVPLTGGLGYTRTEVGTMSLDNVNYVEFDADTWDYGFTLWVDGVQFSPCDPITSVPNDPVSGIRHLAVYPNPASDFATLLYTLERQTPVCLKLIDLNGKVIRVLVNENQSAGEYQETLVTSDLRPGIYLINLLTTEGNETKRLVICGTL
jgi:parallel beta-helix repeat protein